MDKVDLAVMRADLEHALYVGPGEVAALLEVAEAAKALDGDDLPLFVQAVHDEGCLRPGCNCGEILGRLAALKAALSRFA